MSPGAWQLDTICEPRRFEANGYNPHTHKHSPRLQHHHSLASASCKRKQRHHPLPVSCARGLVRVHRNKEKQSSTLSGNAKRRGFAASSLSSDAALPRLPGGGPMRPCAVASLARKNAARKAGVQDVVGLQVRVDYAMLLATTKRCNTDERHPESEGGEHKRSRWDHNEGCCTKPWYEGTVPD